MSSRNLFRLSRLSAVTLLIAFVLATPVRGEFTVGERIPPFALTAPGGMTIEAAFDGDRLAITRGDATVKPSVTVVHLLQPDCLQCRAQLQALKRLRADVEDPAVAFLGIAHRGEPAALAKLAEALDVGFPMVTGVGSAVADRFAAGDTLGILDQKGVVRFAQVGYAQGDEALWRDAIEAIRAGRPVTRSGVDRERLAVGDVMPAVTLPSLRTGEPMALVGEGGRLAFHQADREPVHPEAAVGFFSRY